MFEFLVKKNSVEAAVPFYRPVLGLPPCWTARRGRLGDHVPNSYHGLRSEPLHSYNTPPENVKMVLKLDAAIPGWPAVYTLLLSV